MERLTDVYKMIGVVIGYFQTPDLHQGHKYLLDWVFARHETLCIVLRSKNIVPTEENPLSFEDRKEMILELYPHAKVIEVFDCDSNKIWSKHIDEKIHAECGHEVILYGSVNSFIPHYNGRYSVEELAPIESPSEMEMRKECAAYNSTSYRNGVINSPKRRFPILFPTVDGAMFKKENGIYYVLLGHKEMDEDKYRFIGGFASKGDASFEESISREYAEETGGKILHKKPEYIASCPVSDYRYENTKDGVMTTFFGIEYQSGVGIATDDVDKLIWVPLHDLMDIIVPSHKILAEKLISFLNKKQSFFKKIISFLTSKN